MLTAALSGFSLGGALIVAIGAQNAYILRMGLLRHHVFWLCLYCAVSDAALIIAGVAGLGALVNAMPSLLRWLAFFGFLFLASYALLAAKRAFYPHALKAADAGKPSLAKAIVVCTSFTWLNPHVYLDTVVLVGAFSTRYEDAVKIAFGAGAATASFVWFFGLGYGARLLAPLFARPMAWRVLDGLIALVMTLLALQLLLTAIRA